MKHATHCWFTRVQYLVLTLLLSVSQCLISSTLMAQEAKVTSLMRDKAVELAKTAQVGVVVNNRISVKQGTTQRSGKN